MARAPCRLRCHNKILPKSDWRPASGPRLMAMDGRYTAPRHPKRTLRRCINYRPSCAHRCTLHTAHANWRHSRSLGRIQFSHIQWVACQRLSCVRYPCASGLQSNYVRKRYCRAEITSADGVQFVHLAGVYASERRDVAGMDGNCHRLGHAVFRWSGVGCLDGGVGACLVTGSVQRSVRSSHTGYRHLCWCTRRWTRFVSGQWATSVIQLGNALNFSRFFHYFIVGRQRWSIGHSIAQPSMDCRWSGVMGPAMWRAKSTGHLYARRSIHPMGHREFGVLNSHRFQIENTFTVSSFFL